MFSLSCNDDEFSSRFNRIFGECEIPFEMEDHSPQSHLSIRSVPKEKVTVISMSDSTTDRVEFLTRLFPESEYECTRTTNDNWQLVTSNEDRFEPVFAFKGDLIIASWLHKWQIVVAHFAIANAMRIQKDVCFFHGATIAMNKHGVMLGGDKGSGKTTLSLALAERGHGFLSDEYATILESSRMLLPFRRAASIRDGPQAELVEAYLKEHGGDREVMLDGTVRVRVPVVDLLPKSHSASVALTHVFFLSGFADKPAVSQFDLGVADVKMLSPLLGTLWGHSVAQRTITMLRIFSQVNCYRLTVGGLPKNTVDLIEKVVGDVPHVSTA